MSMSMSMSSRRDSRGDRFVRVLSLLVVVVVFVGATAAVAATADTVPTSWLGVSRTNGRLVVSPRTATAGNLSVAGTLTVSGRLGATSNGAFLAHGTLSTKRAHLAGNVDVTGGLVLNGPSAFAGMGRLSTTPACSFDDLGRFGFHAASVRLVFCDGRAWQLVDGSGPMPGAETAYGDGVGNPGKSCADIRTVTGRGGVRVQWILPATETVAFATWCDLDTDGGGWTLVLRDAHDGQMASDQTGAIGVSGTLSVGGAPGAGASAKLADATINAIRAEYSTHPAYRVSSPSLTERVLVPGTCTYAHRAGASAACRQCMQSKAYDPLDSNPAYTQCEEWGGGAGGIACWFGCGVGNAAKFTNVAVTHRGAGYASVAEIVSNVDFAPLGNANAQYGNVVLLWVR